MKTIIWNIWQHKKNEQWQFSDNEWVNEWQWYQSIMDEPWAVLRLPVHINQLTIYHISTGKIGSCLLPERLNLSSHHRHRVCSKPIACQRCRGYWDVAQISSYSIIASGIAFPLYWKNKRMRMPLLTELSSEWWIWAMLQCILAICLIIFIEQCDVIKIT